MHPFPSVPVGVLKHVDSEESLYSPQHRYASPGNSGLSSSQISSNWSDMERTPHSSPEASIAYLPEGAYVDHAYYTLDGHGCHGSLIEYGAGHCVALHDVQQHADTQPEKVAFEDEHVSYGVSAQEGYQPLQSDDDARYEVPVVPSQRATDETPNRSHGHEVAPVLRRRRAQSSRSVTSPYQPSKVTKRPGVGKRSASYQGKLNGDSGARSFPCPFSTYGCQSTFGSKNEWKRHVNTQHMRLGFWRCDQCPQGDRKPNDFNRKDLFIQHVRRMHPIEPNNSKSTKSENNVCTRGNKDDPEEQALIEASKRCYRKLRSPPEQSGCLFCDATFEGSTTWEERMEHVGKHMETAKKDGQEQVNPQDWRHDQATEDYLMAQGLVVRSRGHLVLVDLK